jgi:DNA-binding response OmpR family regulator
MNVVLLEPDKILAENYEFELSNFGFKVRRFYNPQDAVQAMDDNLPNAIILELQLSPLSGVAFLYELRSYEDFANVPVIVYSSIPKENFKIDDKGWAELGVIKYFYKPRIPITKVASYTKGILS